MGSKTTVPVRIMRPIYTGFAPIATCHWQSLANILAARGLADALRKLVLSWGFSWDGGDILFGGGRWPTMLLDLFGVVIDQHASPEEHAEALELDLARRGLPFVAEIDAFFVTSPYQGQEHVVHTVVVMSRDDQWVEIVDVTNNPRQVTVPAAIYRTMRCSKSAGRIEPWKLYVPTTGPTKPPATEEILNSMKADIMVHGKADLARLGEFIDHYESSDRSVNVCRAAAERLQAAQAFDLLADDRVTGAADVAAALRSLSDQWYLVHMLTTHPRGDDPRQRRRVSRLLIQIMAEERAVHARLELL
jgi:hypothetical protein